MLGAAGRMVTDQYGNYVLQHILQHGRPEHRAVIIDNIKGRLLALAQHKFASNVIERALDFGSASEKRALVDEIVNPSVAMFRAFQGMPDESSGGPVTPLQILMRDQFGNYVVQKLMDIADDAQRMHILEMLRAYAPVLRRYTYGKHILARMEKMAAKTLLPMPPGSGGVVVPLGGAAGGGIGGVGVGGVPFGWTGGASSYAPASIYQHPDHQQQQHAVHAMQLQQQQQQYMAMGAQYAHSAGLQQQQQTGSYQQQPSSAAYYYAAAAAAAAATAADADVGVLNGGAAVGGGYVTLPEVGSDGLLQQN